MRLPSAFLPLAMSLAALGMVLVHAAVRGAVHEADEGTAAHIFQLLMAAQLPWVGYFAVRWLPQAPRPALRILGLQAAAALAAILAVAVLT